MPAFFVWLESIAYDYGYPGVFLLSLIGHATIFFPIPTYLVVYALGSQMDPFLLGLFAGLGAAIGELTSYFVGYGVEAGVHIEKKKFGGSYMGARSMFQKYGFWAIPVFAATPLPTDAIGLTAGLLRYSVSKFFIGCLIGKLAMHWALAYGGAYTHSLLSSVVLWVFGSEGSIIGWLVFALIVVAAFLAWWKYGKDLKIELDRHSRA